MMFYLPYSLHFVKVLSFLIVASEWDIRQSEIDKTLLKYLWFGQGCGWEVTVAGVLHSKVLNTHARARAHTHTHTHIHTVWAEAMRFEYNRLKYIRVQRLMNIKIAKAFRTTSTEALCMLAGMTPIIIRTEEAVKQYFLRKGKGALTQSVDLEVERKYWPHPADVVEIIEVKEYDDKTIQIYTDGSRNEQGVGSGVVIFSGKELVTKLKYKLDNRCSNNQAEQLAIANALEALETTAI